MASELTALGRDGIELRSRSASLEALERAEVIDARWQFGLPGRFIAGLLIKIRIKA